MARNIQLLNSTSDDFKIKLADWSDKWYAIRKRHPFFLLHAGDQEINGFTVEILKKYVTSIKNWPIDVIIHSPGGEMQAAFKSTLIFQSICEYTAVIPKYAKSGATLFSLGGSEIIFGKWAELGPLDPQVPTFVTERKYWRGSAESALESFHATRYAQREVIQQFNAFIDFLISVGLSGKSSVQDAIKLTEATIGKVYSNVSSFDLGSSGRLLDVMEQYCLRVLQKSYSSLSLPQRKNITKQFVWEYPIHDYYIDCEEAGKMKLRVSEAPNNIQVLLDELNPDYGNCGCLGIALPIPAPTPTPTGVNP